jgi:PAS domain S-box-containing protein
MFTLAERQQIAKAWDSFTKTGTIKTGNVRKIIYESWKRSRDFGLNPYELSKPIISSNELNEKIASHKELIEIAQPHMENLFHFVKGSGFLVILCDEQGYILKLIGDESILEKAQKSKLIVGANRSEMTSGTNAIGTCLALNKPIQVWAEEHYFKGHQEFTCSAAPIYNSNNELIGCLDITGPWEKVHLHTLGMVVAAVDGIEKQMRMKTAYNEINLMNNQLTATLESISEGIIVIDSNGIIKQINELATNMIRASKDQVIGKSINNYLDFNRFLNDIKISKRDIYDREVTLNLKNGSLNCTMTVTAITNSFDHVDRLVVTLKEMKFVHKLVNRMVGSQAHFTFNSIIGKSNSFKETIKLAKIASSSNSNVLLLGESGTGKELFAQAIHNSSSRRNGPFVAVNCAALPRGLIESELFGYEGGSFTGSKKEGRPGKFELANGGTFFLDEIGDMPMEIQASLLRVIQNKEVMRIGSKRAQKIDVRIIAATNKNLEEAIENNTFRSDLYYRLNVFSIHIPPLRERKDDIKELADYFMATSNICIEKCIQGIEDEAYNILVEYDWPGNVRELENCIERATNVAQGRYIAVNDLPQHIVNKVASKKNVTAKDKTVTFKEMEQETIIRSLERHNGNIKKAAEELGIGRRTLYRKLEKYSINYERFRNQ